MRKVNLLITVALCLLITSGLSAQDGRESGAASAVQVVTTIKPVQLIVSAITDGVTTPAVLIPANQSYHHYTLRPSAVRTITNADLLVWVGPALETWLATVIEGKEQSLAVLEIMSLPGLVQYPLNKESVAQTENQDHSHHGSIDAHVWLDTDNALLIASSVTAQLVALDPRHAAVYSANLQRFQSAVELTKQRNLATLSALEEKSYAVYHNAFQYFEKQNGLQHQLVFVNNEDLQPGVRHIRSIRNALRELQPVCLLEDVTTNPATVNTVLGDYTINRHRADILGESLQPGPLAYVQLLENLADVMQNCLGPD